MKALGRKLGCGRIARVHVLRELDFHAVGIGICARNSRGLGRDEAYHDAHLGGRHGKPCGASLPIPVLRHADLIPSRRGIPVERAVRVGEDWAFLLIRAGFPRASIRSRIVICHPDFCRGALDQVRLDRLVHEARRVDRDIRTVLGVARLEHILRVRIAMTGALGKLGVGHLARVHHDLALARALAKRLSVLVISLGSIELLGAQRVRRDRRRIVHRTDGRKHRTRRATARERCRGTACGHGDGDLRVRLILLRLHLEQIAEKLALG